MVLKNFKILIPIIIVAINLPQTEATKCGRYFCDGKSECKPSKDKDGLECVCDEGFVSNITGNVFYCQPTPINSKTKCVRIGDKCGSVHICNHNLICEETNTKNLDVVVSDLKKCPFNEDRCLERCCHANEICIKGKCITKPPTLYTECPETLYCLGKCCAENEFCNAENVCVSMSDLHGRASVAQCFESKKCEDKCCQDHEICENDKKCVLKKINIRECPESQKCLEKCCSPHEKCENQSECVLKMPHVKECPQEQICLKTCCKETEKCSHENKCVAKESPDNENTLMCLENHKCLDKCCAENETCSEHNVCVTRSLLRLKCAESQMCLNKCCPITQICSKDLKCVDTLLPSSTAAISATLSTSLSAPDECPLNKQCLNTCCKEEEKCNKLKECIPINTIDCIETDLCGDNCCSINEICNEYHECVPIIDETTLANCPLKLQCFGHCCEPHEVCNESNVCVTRIVKKELLNNDVSAPELLSTETTFDASVYLTGLKHHMATTAYCAPPYFVCQNICCHHKQICSSAGQCIDPSQEDIKLRDCESQQNCIEIGSLTEPQTSLAYTIIGLGCLVIALLYSLFKVYAFRRSNRILY